MGGTTFSAKLKWSWGASLSGLPGGYLHIKQHVLCQKGDA